VELEFRTSQIEEIAIPLKSLSEVLAPNILKQDYGLLISEGVSARVPTLVIGRVIKKLTSEIPAIFLVPRSSQEVELGRVITLSMVGNLIKSGKRALVCTEIINAGEHIRRFGGALRGLDVSFDLGAMLSCYDEGYYREQNCLSPDTRYYFGYRYPERVVERLSYFDRTPRCSVYKQDWLNVDMWPDLLTEDIKNSHLSEKTAQVKADLDNLVKWITTELKTIS